MALLVPRERRIRLESFAAPDVCALARSNIRMSVLVLRQGTVQFKRLSALFTRIRVNVIAYEVKDVIFEVVVILKV